MTITTKISHRAIVEQAEAFAPSNIALAKYWGKQDQQLNIPINPSLSITLDRLGTRSVITEGVSDRLQINGQIIASQSSIHTRVFDWLTKICGNARPNLYISTFSNIPISAGVASSASAFASLTIALSRFFGWDFSKEFLSIIARLGSASAARSIHSGFVTLIPKLKEQQLSCFAEPVEVKWPNFRLALLNVSRDIKVKPSTEGMLHTQNTSPLFKAWPEFAERSFTEMLKAVENKDLSALGQAAEHNAFTMHATMMAARPTLLYLSSQSFKMLEQVHQLRQQGTEVYATMDAGANIKLLFLLEQQRHIEKYFDDLTIINPFATD